MKKRTLTILLSFFLLGTGQVNATVISYTGNFLDDNSRFYTLFDVTTDSLVTLTSYGYAGGTNGNGEVIYDGGFDSQLFIFDSVGALLFSDDDSSSVVSSSSGQAYDALISEFLSIGSYVAVLTQFDSDYISGDLITGSWSDADTTDFVDFAGYQRTSGYAFDIEGEYISNVSAVTTDAIDVPEPSSLAIFGAGLLGFFGLRRKRKIEK